MFTPIYHWGCRGGRAVATYEAGEATASSVLGEFFFSNPESN